MPPKHRTEFCLTAFPRFETGHWAAILVDHITEVMIAKVLHCNDVVGNCDFVAKGETEQDILRQAVEHARTAHNVKEVTPELADRVRSAIRDEAA